MASCINTLLLTFLIICVSFAMVSGDVPFPKGKRCFPSTLCPTGPQFCDNFCRESLGDLNGGFCFDGHGVCCCN
ncbi:LCR-like protein [Medicago truncatula]|uniref:LCR-like protein n=1 Tax=Medicago truncatula TaxID=3880 RepID=A0A072VH98_MEDTR|nr:LCR-like protein [Medicago truncatula]